MRKRNNAGHFTKEMSILVTKKLQAIADDVGIRVRPIVRDELERTHRANIYDSYIDAGDGSYHHTGTLASSVKGLIDGNTVKAVIESKPFPNNIRGSHSATSTTEVYDILKYGSRARARTNAYIYEGKSGEPEYARYIQQPPHKFEQRTLEDMEVFLDELARNLKNHPEWYTNKYKKLR